MASIVYPSNVLPNPLIANYNYKDVDKTIQTDMDSGYMKKRRRFTTGPTIFNISLLMDQGALSYFEAWYEEVLLSGLEWFDMELAVGDGTCSVHEVRFMDTPQVQSNSNKYNVTGQIMALKKNIGILYDDVMLGLIESLGGFDQASIYFDKLDVAINVTYPNSGYGPGV